MTRDVHWCVTVDYQQIENDNRANQIHGFTIDYGKFILILYISQLVSAVWLVNFAGRTLLYGPLKCKVVFVAKLFRDLSPNAFNLNTTAIKSLKLSFNQNCVLKRANDLKTISNWLVMLSTCIRNLKPFLGKRNRSWIRQAHSRDIINILLASSSPSAQ